MSDKQNSLECNAICWGIAAFVGFVSMVMLYMLADFGALQAIFTGGLIGTLLGLVLSIFVCRGQKAAADLNSDEKPAQRYAREAAEDKARRDSMSGASSVAASAAAAPTTSAAPAAAAASAPAAATPAGPAVKPSQDLPGQSDLSSRKGEWSYSDDNTTPSSFASVPDAEEKPAPKAKAKAKPKTKAKPKAEKAKPAKAAPAAAAASGDAPQLYTSPTEGAADDLKLISGVGPKLEQTLNEMGIWYFKQVAVWGPSDIAWVDDRLRFKGRIERDDWMSQAKILAEGGETDFSSLKKK